MAQFRKRSTESQIQIKDLEEKNAELRNRLDRLGKARAKTGVAGGAAAPALAVGAEEDFDDGDAASGSGNGSHSAASTPSNGSTSASRGRRRSGSGVGSGGGVGLGVPPPPIITTVAGTSAVGPRAAMPSGTRLVRGSVVDFASMVKRIDDLAAAKVAA